MALNYMLYCISLNFRLNFDMLHSIQKICSNNRVWKMEEMGIGGNDKVQAIKKDD